MQPANPGSGDEARAGNLGIRVKQGDCIFSIANQHGHYWRRLWDHPENAALKDMRGSPHVLREGDRVFVPELSTKSETGATETRHRFTLKGTPIDLAIEVLDDDEPRAGEPYVLEIEGRTEHGGIPDDGIIRTRMLATDRQGRLTVGEGEDRSAWPLQLGHLDPAHTRSGALHRLFNMGFIAEPSADTEGYAVALERFQQHHRLEATGRLDGATISKLAQVHGS
jgi:hypothetical protein